MVKSYESSEFNSILKEALEWRRGQKSRETSEWRNAVATHLSLCSIIIAVFVIIFKSLVEPVQSLQAWRPVTNCIVKDFMADFVAGLGLSLLVKLEVEFDGEFDRTKGYATQSVIGQRMPQSQGDFLTFALEQKVFPTCFVNPDNILIVALDQSEVVPPMLWLLLSCVVLLLLLQVAALVQTCYFKKATLCICSRGRAESSGYGVVPQS